MFNDTGLEFCQATVGSIKRVVHAYKILTGKIHQISNIHPTCDKLICTVYV